MHINWQYCSINTPVLVIKKTKQNKTNKQTTNLQQCKIFPQPQNIVTFGIWLIVHIE